MPATNMFPVFDGHNDTLLHMHIPAFGKGRSFFIESTWGHIDLPRARKGGFGGGFFAICPVDPARTNATNSNQNANSSDQEIGSFPALDPTYAQQFTLAVAARLFHLEREAEGQIKIVRTSEELQSCLREGILAAILHFEGAEALDPQLNALEVFYQAGLRSLGIVWSRSNAFAHGVPFDFPRSPDTGPGLTEAGKDLVRACNRLHILLDLSHLNEQGFWDVARLSDAPLVATHSNAHALCASTRNLTDKQLDAIKASTGMVGVNFHAAFLRADGCKNPNTSLDEIIRHVDYLVEHLGIDS
ncbi:MAG: dipeptidase, partial [Ktedonobacteraceae bacterium]